MCIVRLVCRRLRLHGWINIWNLWKKKEKKHYCRCYCGGKPETSWRIRSFWKCPWWRWWGVKIDDFINVNSDRNAWLEIVRPLWWRRWQVWVGGGQVCEVLKWQLNEYRKNLLYLTDSNWLAKAACVVSCDWTEHRFYKYDEFPIIMSYLIALSPFLLLLSV